MQGLIAATGHRPNKLGGYGRDVYTHLVKLAYDYLGRMQPEGVISGMALGWDQAWADAALLLNIPVHAAIPFEGLESQWPNESKNNFHRILKRCTSVTVVCEGLYAGFKMQIRNEWMVDRAVRICALWDGSPGGTGNCLKYKGDWQRPVDNLWPQWLELTHPSALCNTAPNTVQSNE